jgi:hypothetical protein
MKIQQTIEIDSHMVYFLGSAALHKATEMLERYIYH